MALKVGELYVALTANVSGFAKGMQGAADTVSRVSRELKQLSQQVAQIGLGLTASVGGMVATAAKFDKGVSESVRLVRGQFNALSIEVAQVAAPAMREVADAVGNVVRWFRALSPEQRSAITHWMEFALQATAVSVAMAKLTGIVASVAKVVALLAPAFSAAALPAAAIAAGIAVAVLATGALYRAWNDTETGLKKGVLSVAQTIRDVFLKVADFVVGLFTQMLDSVLSNIRAALKLAAAAANALRQFDLGTKLQIASEALRAENFVRLFAEGASEMLDLAVAGAQKLGSGIKAGFEYSLGGLKDLAKNLGLDALLEKLQAFRSSFDVGGAVAVPTPRESTRDRTPFVDRAWQVAGAAAQGFVQRVPVLGAAIEGANQGAMLGGPWGALAGAVLGLVSQSKSFSRLMETINQGFQWLADVLGAVVDPLTSLLEALVPLAPVVELLAWPLRGLAEVLRWASIAILGVVHGLARAWNALMDFLKSVGIDTSAWRIDTRALEQSLTGMMHGTRDAGEAVAGLGDAARTATEEILNAPQGFKGLALYRYGAADPDAVPPWMPGGGGAGTGGAGGGVGGAGGAEELPPEERIDPRGRGHIPEEKLNVQVAVGVDLRRYIQVEGRLLRYGNTGAGATPLDTSLAYSY